MIQFDRFIIRMLTIFVVAVALPCCAVSEAPGSSDPERLKTMERSHRHTLDELDASRRALVQEAGDAIEALDPKASDAEIHPILAALEAASFYDPGNEAAQTAWMLIHRYGEQRIRRLIGDLDQPSFLLTGLASVSAESEAQ